MRALKHSFAAATVSVVALLSAAPVMAQSQSKTPEAVEPQAPSRDISDKQLDQTAAAMQQVMSVKRSYRPQIEAAEPDRQQHLLDEATSAMVKAITDQGLSVDEYNSIIQVAQNDPAVRDKLLARIDKSGQQ
jgi:hypothetical protein